MTAAWGLLLSRYAGAPEVVFGNVVSGRGAAVPGIEAIVGSLINTLPCVCGFPAEGGSSTCSPRRRPRRSRSPRMSRMGSPPFRAGAAAGRAAALESGGALQNFPQVPAAVQAGAGLRVSWHPADAGEGSALSRRGYVACARTTAVVFDPRRFERSQIELLSRRYTALLEGLVADPERRVDDVSMLLPEELEGHARGWTAHSVSPHRSLGERFVAQAERTPEAVALEQGATRVTYSALKAETEGLAQALRSEGCGAEMPVALLMERSAELFTAMIAVTRAGSAFVVLDPSAPVERLRSLLADCGAHRVLVRDDAPPEHRELSGAVAFSSFAVGR